jgi:hypothetical protein
MNYPPYVNTDEERRRWDTCAEVAEAVFGDLPPASLAEQVWSATRSLYFSALPIGDEPERSAD